MFLTSLEKLEFDIFVIFLVVTESRDALEVSIRTKTQQFAEKMKGVCLSNLIIYNNIQSYYIFILVGNLSILSLILYLILYLALCCNSCVIYI